MKELLIFTHLKNLQSYILLYILLQIILNYHLIKEKYGTIRFKKLFLLILGTFNSTWESIATSYELQSVINLVFHLHIRIILCFVHFLFIMSYIIIFFLFMLYLLLCFYLFIIFNVLGTKKYYLLSTNSQNTNNLVLQILKLQRGDGTKKMIFILYNETSSNINNYSIKHITAMNGFKIYLSRSNSDT